MVKRSIEQDIRNKNFGARNGNYERNAEVKNQGSKQRVQRILGDCWQWESNGQCSKGDNCSFRHDINKRGKMTQSNTSPSSFMRQNERKALRTRSPRGKSPSGRMFRWPCKDYLKGTCNNSFFLKGGTLQNACSTRPRVVADLGKSAHMHIVRLMNYLSKMSKKNDDKSAVAMLKRNDWHENVREPVVNHVKGHDRSGRPDEKRDYELKRRTYWKSIIECTAIGLCLSRHEAAEVYSPEELRHAETNPTCKIHEGYCTSH